MLVDAERLDEAETLWQSISSERPVADEIGIYLRQHIYTLSFQYRQVHDQTLVNEAEKTIRIAGIAGKKMLGDRYANTWKTITGVALDAE